MGLRPFVGGRVGGLCAASAREPDLNRWPSSYVRLALEIGTHEEGYIDAYYGPPEWKTKPRRIRARPRS